MRRVSRAVGQWLLCNAPTPDLFLFIAILLFPQKQTQAKEPI